MPLGIPDTRAFPWDQSLKRHLGQLNNGVTGGINTWAVNPTVGVDGLALGANHIGYTGINTTTSTIMRWDGSAWISALDGSKIVNTPQLNVYVSKATGNDNNDGLSSSTAWQTTSKFYQEIYKYNLGGKQVNLYLGAGSYNVRFPPNAKESVVRIYGASSASVLIQNMVLANQTVILQDVTIGYPEVLDETVFYWPVNASDNSKLYLGQNVVLGPIGTYASNKNRIHIYCRDQSTIYISALYPVTVSGSVNQVFSLLDSSYIGITTYIAATAGLVTPNAAPPVSTGAGNIFFPALGSSDLVATINCVGSITVNALMILKASCNINGGPNWKLNITGNVLGSAYTLLEGSSILGNVSKGSVPATRGIGFPTTISSGSADGTSSITGVGF